MNGILRALAFLALSFVVGQVVKKSLTSRPGRALLNRIGHPELATLEGAEEATKKINQGIELARSLVSQEEETEKIRERLPTGPRWVRIIRDASEMLLATGSLLKAVSDFVREDERLRMRLHQLGMRVD